MVRIEDVDKNMKLVGIGDRDDIVFYDCLQEPFKVYGLITPKTPEDIYERIPMAVAETVSKDVKLLNNCTAGGRVRFRTDSPFIAIYTKQHHLFRFPSIALSGSAGFDMYYNEGQGEIFRNSFKPPCDITDGYDSLLEFAASGVERDITINFPLYGGVNSLLIGVKKGSRIMAAPEYTIKVPIVYYGSSITQGGNASRPGISYQSIISRRLDADYLNLGFSGSACGEDEIAEYIADLKMSAFVYDYDANAHNRDHLERTHERMFRTIRKKHPDLPIVIASLPIPRLAGEWIERRKVILKTYENAKAAGDQNVYFVDGSTMFDGGFGDDAMSDGIHPNDIGFYCMAQKFGDVLEQIFRR